MKRALLILLALAGLGVAGWRLRIALASDETLIRWRIEQMASGFDRTRLVSVMEGFETDYRDATSGLDRQDVMDALRWTFLQEIDPKTREFRWTVEVPSEAVVVELDPDEPERARAALTASFRVRGEPERPPSWVVAIEGELEKGERGWVFVRSTHETLENDGELVR